MSEELELHDLSAVRRDKLKQLEEQGIDAFGQKFERTHTATSMTEQFNAFSKDELADKEATAIIAGRIMTKRGKGKAGFAHIQDLTGQIQLYVRQDAVGEEHTLYLIQILGTLLVFRERHLKQM